MQQIVNVTIDESGRSIADSKSIGLQYETGVAQFVIAPDPSWVSDQYFYYLIVSPPEDSDKKQYAVPLVNQGGTFVFKISSGITWTVGNYKFAFIAMSKELTDGRVPSDGIVSISTAWNCKIEKSILDYVSLQSQPEDANFQLLYTDLMALSVEVRKQTAYAKEQGDYANEQATLAKNIIVEFTEAAQYANAQGDYAKEKGDFANAQANYAKEQGDYAKEQAESAYTEAQYATKQGNYAKNQGDYAKEQGDNASAQTLVTKIQGDNAETQANYAKTQGDYAKTKGQYAEEQGTYAKTQGDYAKTQGTNAQTQANNASTQANNAQAQATYAQTQGDYAKRVGDTVQGQIDRLRANQIQGSASGTELVIQDSANMESILHLSGNSEQETRSGKNEFKLPKTATKNGITFTNNGDGTFNMIGTATTYTAFTILIDNNFQNNIKYVSSVLGNIEGISWRIDGYDSNDKWVRLLWDSTSANNFTVNVTGISKINCVIDVATGVTLNITNAGLQIEEGETSTSYEPYGATPSPDYPSEIRSVKGKSDNLVKLYANTGSVTSAGVTVTMIDYNTVKINGTATANSWIELLRDFKDSTNAKTDVAIPLDNSKYTASCFVKSGSYNGADSVGYITFATTDGSAETQNAINFGKSKTFNGLKGIGRIFLAIKSGVTYNNFVVKVQLNKGDKALPYQPYGYVPVEVKVEGKNLFDKDNYNLVNLYPAKAGAKYSKNYMSVYIKIKPNTTYTVYRNVIVNADINLATYTEIPIEGTPTDNAVWSGTNIPVSITSGTNDNYLLAYIASAPTNYEFANIINGLQILEGSYTTDTMPPYEPYKSQTIQIPLGDIELRSTPDSTRDTFERVDGVWNVVGKAPSVIFDGVNIKFEKKSSSTTNTVYLSEAIYPVKDLEMVMSNRFKGTKQDLYDIDGIGIYTSGNRIRFAFGLNSELTTLELANDWLVNNPLHVVYPTTTPTYTPITDPALISALDELEQLILHKGYNRITATSVNGVKAYLDLTYVKDINTVLNNLTAMIATIGGEINV